MNKFKVGDWVWCDGYKGVIIYFFHDMFFEVDWGSYSTFIGSSDAKPIRREYAILGEI